MVLIIFDLPKFLVSSIASFQNKSILWIAEHELSVLFLVHEDDSRELCWFVYGVVGISCHIGLIVMDSFELIVQLSAYKLSVICSISWSDLIYTLLFYRNQV